MFTVTWLGKSRDILALERRSGSSFSEGTCQNGVLEHFFLLAMA
jgi:hypothetical protein